MTFLDCSGSNSKHGAEGRVRQLGIRFWFGLDMTLAWLSGGRLSGTAGLSVLLVGI